MGILAINAMSTEGQVGTAAITPAASNLQANVDFATELDRKLQGDTNPTLTSGASEPEGAPGKGSSSKDGNQSQQAVSPSAVSLAAIVTAVPVTAQSNSPAGNKPTPNPEQAATISSDSANSLSPEIASTFAKDSAHAQPADETSQDKDSKAPSASKAASVEDSSTLQPSRPAQAFATGQDGPAYVAGSTSERMDAPDTKSLSRLGKGLQSAGVETPAPLQNVTTQLKPQDPSSGPQARAGRQAESGPGSQSNAQDAIGPKAQISTLTQQSRDLSRSIPFELPKAASTSAKTEASQYKDSKASSANKATPTEASSTLQPSRLAQDVITGQENSAPVTGSAPMWERIEVTSPSRLGKELQSAGMETFAPSHKGTAQLEPQDPPSGPQAKAWRQAESGPESQASAQDAIGSNPQISTLTQQSRDSSSSIPFELPKAASTSPKTEASQYKDSKATSANKAAPAEASSTLQPSQTAQVVTEGNEGSALVTASVPTPARIETLQATSRSSLGTELQGAGAESTVKTENSQGKVKETTAPPANIAARTEDSSSPQPSRLAQGVITGQEGSPPGKGSAATWERIETTSLSNLGKGLQAAGTETPLHQGTTQLDQQDPSGVPEARTRQPAESGPQSQSSAHAATDPQIPTPGPYSPDFLPPMPFELTKVVSTGRVDEPQNSNRIKNSQEGDPAASGVNSDAAPGGTPASLVQDPAQTKDIETGSSVHDTKQADTSADNKGGEAAQDLTKVADGKGGLPKANADPALAPQLVPEGRAEAGRASPEAAGAAQGPGGAGSASVLEGYQANAETVVRSARFTQQAGNAEMRVRLSSETLGPIDVHTIVKGSDIGASIRVEAHDTQVMLANELSQLERALSERSLRVEHLDVLQGSVSGGGPEGTGSGNSHGSPSEPRQSFSRYSAGQTYSPLPEAPTVSEDWGLGLSTTRINLRV